VVSERKLGELLNAGPKATGGDAQRTRFHKRTESPPTYAEQGIDKKLAMRAQRLAMAVAMLYPEPKKGGRGKKNSVETTGFSVERLSRARTVLHFSQRDKLVSYNSQLPPSMETLYLVCELPAEVIAERVTARTEELCAVAQSLPSSMETLY
jgi:hypothetical protein